MSGTIVQPRTRNYGIDLLRIVAISMILVLHILGKNNVLVSTEKLSANFNAAWFMEIACYCAVDCYALISGYVGIHAKHKATNIAMLWLQVAFYSVGATLIFRLFVPNTVDKLIFFKSLFPVMARQYWYFTSYFGLFILIPFLNAAIHALTKKRLESILMIGFVVFSAVSIPFFKDPFLFNNGYSMFWLAVLYVFGAYFGKYKVLERVSKVTLSAVYIGCVLITWGTKLLITRFYDDLPRIMLNKNFLVSYMSPTVLLAAIALLGICANLKISARIGKIISYVASLSFGVYLVQSQPLISNQFMVDSFAKFAAYPTLKMVAAVLGTMVLIFVVCGAIDAIRQQLFKLLRLKQAVAYVEHKLTAGKST